MRTKVRVKKLIWVSEDDGEGESEGEHQDDGDGDDEDEGKYVDLGECEGES